MFGSPFEEVDYAQYVLKKLLRCDLIFTFNDGQPYFLINAEFFHVKLESMLILLHNLLLNQVLIALPQPISLLSLVIVFLSFLSPANSLNNYFAFLI
jgi:hypothetical protein